MRPPDCRPNSVPRMLIAQYGLELKLLLRNGEQLLLTMFIPITLLVGLTVLPLGDFGDNRVAVFVPAIMALAVISTAFTGQAIAVAFDRRYGALKRLGATPLPVWGIIAGKALAMLGRGREADDSFERCFALAPVRGMMARAAEHHKARRLQDAEKLCRKVLQIQPRHVEALRMLGLIAAAAGNLDEAEHLLRQTLASAPDHTAVMPQHRTAGM